MHNEYPVCGTKTSRSGNRVRQITYVDIARRLGISCERVRQIANRQKIKEQAKTIRNSLFHSITALAYALEAKDIYTSRHSQKVTEISVALAKELGLLRNNIEEIQLAGLIHDIGKIGVKESVLNKPGKLTQEEFQLMRLHSEIGEHILKPVIEDEEILKIVRHHHERYDGNGYPDRMKSKQIPLGARIVAVADTYDAMTSKRPYREAMDPKKACAEIKCCRGSQFDPEVVEIFLKMRNSLIPSISHYIETRM